MAEVQKNKEEKMKKLLKEEEERRLGDVAAQQKEKDFLGRRDSISAFDGVDVPDVKMADNVEVKVRNFISCCSTNMEIMHL